MGFGIWVWIGGWELGLDIGIGDWGLGLGLKRVYRLKFTFEMQIWLVVENIANLIKNIF